MRALRESETCELKREYAASVLKEVVAFLNTHGGELYLGIEDDGTPCGLADCPEVELRVRNALRDAVRPDASHLCAFATEALDGCDVLRVSVAEGACKPYYLASKGLRPEGVYVRQGASAAPASEGAIREMIKAADAASYETECSLEQELSFEAASGVFARAGLEFGEAQMRTLGIVGDDGLYTNLGLLVSDQCPHVIKAARFSGSPEDCAFQDRAEFSGSVFAQLEDAFAYLDARNQLGSTFEGLRRVDVREYPMAALREALVNAVVHRDYAAGAPLLLKMYDAELQLVNFGGLMPGVELEDLRQGVSRARNPRLAAIFYRLSLIEAYGTGMGRIFGAYRTCGMTPRVSCTRHSFLVVLPNRNAGGDGSLGEPPATEPLRVLEGGARAATSGGHVGGGGAASSVAMRAGAFEMPPAGGGLDGCPQVLGAKEMLHAGRTRGDAAAKRPAPLLISRTDLGEQVPGGDPLSKLRVGETYDVYATFDLADIERTIRFVEVHGSVTRKEVEELLGVRQTAAGKVLRGLVDSSVLAREGRGPKTRYRLIG